jgi:hypothetical protein
LRKEYCSAADVPAIDVQTQLHWNKVRALIFYLVPSVSGKTGEKKNSLLLEIGQAAVYYIEQTSSCGPF